MSNATYTKLRDGSWGIRATAAVSPGSLVTVTKKSGESKSETVDRIVWSGNGVWLCSIRKTAAERTGCSCGSLVNGGNAFGRKNCWTCVHDS